MHYSTDVENGEQYIDELKDNENYVLKPLEQFKPESKKYNAKIKQQLEKLLGSGKTTDNAQIIENYTKDDIANFYKHHFTLKHKDKVKALELDKKFLNLDFEEVLAVFDYSYHGFEEVNNQLRNDNVDKINSSYIKILTSALNKLPNFEGTVFRGTRLTEEAFNAYKDAFVNNKPIVTKGFTSSSHKFEVADRFRRNTFFTIKSKTGKKIEELSYFGVNNPDVSTSNHEYEVLFKSKTKFRILSINEKTGEIELEEI